MPHGRSSLRVGIVDDNHLFRDGLVSQLRRAGAKVEADCTSAEDLLLALDTSVPDIVVLDIRLPPDQTDEGIRLARTIRELYPALGILILSTYDSSAYAKAVTDISDRAIGYLIKDRTDNIGILLDAMDRIVAGDCVIDEGVVALLMRQKAREAELDVLTASERKVMTFMAQGLTNEGIAKALVISERTVEFHTPRIFDKLGIYHDPHTNQRVAAVISWLRGNTFADGNPASPGRAADD